MRGTTSSSWPLLALLLLATAAQGQVTFTGTESLGRATQRSVAVNVVASVAIDAFFEYGTVPGGPYTLRQPATGTVSTAANVPLLATLDGLAANTRYYYRMNYRQSGSGTFATRPEYSFVTQRPPGSSFVFTVTSDSHVNVGGLGSATLFPVTLQNIAGDGPDLHFDLGDTFPMDTVTTQAGANSSYLGLRSFFGAIAGSTPLYIVLGNHEQQEGWHLSDTGLSPSLAAISANARKAYYPNPNPAVDAFWSGNADLSFAEVSGNHSLEDYYAFEWGDALFVAIDPYWYSTRKPYVGNTGGGESFTTGTGNRWDWTLGAAQYAWLRQTLEGSRAKYKFIFAHQIVGGTEDYGRGGANAAPYFEWGGLNADGLSSGFAANRAGWAAPIHQLLVQNNVTAFFHGHDHEFAYERRDGVVYQEVPMAADISYGLGFNIYREGDPYTLRVLPNSGHLRITIGPGGATVAYVRAFTPGAGTNGQVGYAYTLLPSAGVVTDFALSATPGNSLSATAAAGQTASYSLQLVPSGAFNGTVGLACSGAPLQSICTVSPASASVSNATLPVTVSVTTTRRSQQASLPLCAFAFALVVWLGMRQGRRGTVSQAAGITLLALAFVALNACGGSDGDSGSSAASSSAASGTGTPAGTYTLVLSATGAGISHNTSLTLVVN